ncbi:FecR family protein [Fodinibius roseus]|uniref:FecR family protein n=1 Tax=Fodinibius roseus TaxID=1194090 RepID=A0A1M5CLP0_9BACT|nr:FecR domain-containing protein [Fodinibius roseus]SHF55648.1 FecR family protein [Fodinibius roseus]
MESDQLNYSLLARYMSGECSSREGEIIEQWMGEDPRNKKTMEEFRQIWETSARKRETSETELGIGGEWDKLKNRLRKEGELRGDIEKRSGPIRKLQKTSSVHSPTRQLMRVAAVLLIAGLLGLGSYWYGSQSQPETGEQALREISTEKAQRANTTLGDGTRVLLNADSKMTLPSEFASDVREVFLEGEAYFDVAGNPDKPFVIHAGESVTRVLGTSFSVRSYPEDEGVRVVVQEGRVSFGAADAQDEQKSVLSANELGRYSLRSNRIETRQVDDMELYLSWRDGYLKFRETPMYKVATALERRYGIEVAFDRQELREKSLTALLKSRSIRNVLDVIAMSLNIEYELKDNKVTFYQQ